MASTSGGPASVPGCDLILIRDGPSFSPGTVAAPPRAPASQNLQVIDLSAGKLVYHTFLEAPGSSFMAKVGAVALLAAAGAAGAAFSPQSFMVPTGTAGSVLAARFKATADADRYRYIFTGEPDATGRKGFSLVRINKQTGEESGRLWNNDRSPNYVVDPVSQTVIVIEEKELVAYRFDTPRVESAPGGPEALTPPLPKEPARP